MTCLGTYGGPPAAPGPTITLRGRTFEVLTEPTIGDLIAPARPRPDLDEFVHDDGSGVPVEELTAEQYVRLMSAVLSDLARMIVPAQRDAFRVVTLGFGLDDYDEAVAVVGELLDHMKRLREV